MYYLIRILKNVKETTATLKVAVETTSEHIGELTGEIKDSIVFRTLFGKKKHKSKNGSH